MKVAIRADASDRIGSGHIMRCRVLADILIQRGAEVLFLCRENPGNLIGMLRDADYRVAALPALSSAQSEAEDCRQTLEVLGDAWTISVDWLIVDHYALGASWETQLRSRARKILAIDDLADRFHDCDVLLDQNFSLNPAARYASLASDETARLLGPRYALLSRHYFHVPQRVPSPAVQRIFVSFGGADADDMTGCALAALSRPEFAAIAVDVVVGSAYRHGDRLRSVAASRSSTIIHEPRATLVDLLTAADLAIGAGGITTWERCRCGLPSVVVTISANQEPASRDLDAAGIIRYVGAREKVTPKILADAVHRLVDDPETRARMTCLGQNLVDGLGALRVTEVIWPSAAAALRLRAAEPKDRAFYFDLANDPDVREQSFTSEPIPWDTHCTWFAAKLADPAARLMVLEVEGLPVGQIRFEGLGGRVTLSYALDAVARGRGWGKRLVALGIEQLMRAGSTPINADVRAKNLASRRIFEQLGFQLVTPADQERLTYLLTDGDVTGKQLDR